MEKILFLCTGNSCRSQIAEGFAKEILADIANIRSAGTQADGLNLEAISIMLEIKVNPNAIKTLKEIGIDISDYKPKTINVNRLNEFDLIITLCEDAKDKCPILNEGIKHIHWNLKDPAKFKGVDLEIMSQFGKLRDLILSKIKELKINLEKGNL